MGTDSGPLGFFFVQEAGARLNLAGATMRRRQGTRGKPEKEEGVEEGWAQRLRGSTRLEARCGATTGATLALVEARPAGELRRTKKE